MNQTHERNMQHWRLFVLSIALGAANYTAPMAPILPPGPVDQASRVVLRKVNRRAPSFISNMVRSRLVGHQVEVGQRILVYQVAFTEPHGLVEVTPATTIEFID